MSDYLIVLGREGLAARKRDIESFIRPSDHVVASCHVAEGIYAMRTRISQQELHDGIVAMLGPKVVFLVAPLSGEWSGQNCTPALRCFRGPDDD